MTKILQELCAERKKIGKTQSDVATEMGTTASAVARLESGGGRKKHSPSLRTLFKFASALGLEVELKIKKV